MIELTKQQFDNFLSNVGMTSYLRDMVITRQFVKPGENCIATGIGGNGFAGIYVYPESSFRYTTPTIAGAYGYYTPNSSHRIAPPSGTSTYILSSALEAPTVMYVIYFLDNNSVNTKSLFTNVDLVSVDYVGQDITKLSFISNYTHLEEINLYNRGHEGIEDLFEGMNLSDGQYIYNGLMFGDGEGVSTYFEFAPGAFKGSKIKKFMLPQYPNIPDELCANCTELLEVVIPNSISIGKNAFNGCTNLQSFYVNGTITELGEGAFDGCINLKDIDVKYGDASSALPSYFGLRGCIMKHELVDNTTKLSIVFANNYWWDGIMNHPEECGFVQSSIAYSFNKLYPSSVTPNTLAPRVGMLYIGGEGGYTGNVTMTDCVNNTYTYTNACWVTQSNIAAISALTTVGGFVKDYFLIPISMFVDEIMANACAGDATITNVNLLDFISLTKIGNNAFKGCSGLSELKLGSVSTHPLLTFGVSAFEKCTSLLKLNITIRVAFSDKSFFGCTSLVNLDFNGTNPGWTPGGSFPELVFGNTPSLASITGTHISIAKNGSTYLNAIIAVDSYGETADRILVGCKNTDFQGIKTKYSCTKVGNGAFYGCTSLIIDSTSAKLGGYTHILNSGFYGCTSIISTQTSPITIKTLTNIEANAFYSCTNLQALDFTSGSSSAAMSVAIGSKAFANSGVKHVKIGTQPFISAIADDAFENCVLSSVQVANHNISVLRDSQTGVENSILKRTQTGGTSVSLIKSGDGKEIVNTDYIAKPVIDIKSNAFTGVTMSDGISGNIIHVPASVATLGKNIMSNSKLNVNNPNLTGTLKLEGEANEQKSGCVVCDGRNPSSGLLYMIGGKYFKNLIEHTAGYNPDYTYYCLTDTQTEGAIAGLDVFEHVPDKKPEDDKKVLSVYYNRDGDMCLTVYCSINANYALQNEESHVNPIDPITLTLMYYGQKYNEQELDVYANGGLTPGETWMGIRIPDDVSFENEKLEYYEYSSSGSSFANINWVDNVTSNRKLNTLTDGFSGCTKLATVKAGGQENDSDIDHNLFDGVVPEGIFSGCTSFNGIIPDGEKIVYPIEYGKKSYSNCNQLNVQTVDSLRLATHFAEESFANTNLTAIDLMSAVEISETAFKSCKLTSARATNTTGCYFTGAGGDCIVDENNIIVVGTPSVEIDTKCEGVADYAFYGRVKNSSWTVSPSYKNRFAIGKSAFSTSDITQYIETGCDQTSIDDEAFSNCASLTNVVLTGNRAVINKKAFSGCTALTNFTLPRKTTIKESCFSGCSSLTTAVVSGTVQKDAFEKCTSLATVRFDYDTNDVKTIDPTAFKSCPITAFTFTNANSSVYNFTANTVSYWNNDGHLELVLGTKTFDMTSMTNYRDLRVIGNHAYNGRGLAGEITIPGSVTEIGDYAFANNPGITKVHIPPTVKSIGDHAFDGCTNLKRVVLPDEICYLGEGAFNGCSLTEGLNCNYEDRRIWQDGGSTTTVSMSINDTDSINPSLDLSNFPITTISSNAFAGSDIKLVHLPADLTKIGASAFSQCLYLSAVYFHSNNESNTPMLSEQAFYGCANISDIYLFGYINTWPGIANGASQVFFEVGSYVPAGKKHIHIKPALNTQAFRNSAFYTQLANKGFTLVQDL